MIKGGVVRVLFAPDTGPSSRRDVLALRGQLAGADLRGQDISALDLRGAVLIGADVRGANVSGLDLRGARLDGLKVGRNQMQDVLTAIGIEVYG